MITVPAGESAWNLRDGLLYEDDDLLIVNKPCGIHSVEQRESDCASVAAALASYLPSLRTVSRDPLESGLVQRLDFETSGALIAAKNSSVWQRLRELLQEGEIKKHYLLLVEGIMTRSAEVSTLLGSRYRHSKKVSLLDEHSGSSGSRITNIRSALPAETNFQPLWSSADLHVTLLEARAPTARRHQIRAHAAHLGHPLLGDELYGSKRALAAVLGDQRPPGVPGFFLHAERVEFLHPGNDSTLKISAPVPLLWHSTVLAPAFATRAINGTS